MSGRKRRTRSTSRRSARPAASARPAEKCITIGRDNPALEVREYWACVSPTQQERLFGGDPQPPIGCGTFACAFPTKDPTRVAKITRDSEDVAALLAAQATGVVPKVHEVYELRGGGVEVSTGKEFPIYGLVVDRMVPIEETDEVAAAMNAVYEYVQAQPPKGTIDVHTATAEVLEDVRATGTDCDRACRHLVRGTLNAVNKLRWAGVAWHDIHPGNVALDPKTGGVRVIDVGISQTELKQPLQVLAGRLAGATLAVRRKIRRLKPPRIRWGRAAKRR